MGGASIRYYNKNFEGCLSLKNYITNNPLENTDKEHTVLSNSLEVARFYMFFGLFFYIGVSELIMDKLLNLKEWELLIRLSYLILLSYLWIRYGQSKNGRICAFAMNNGVYFLISKTSILYPNLYFHINWVNIEQIVTKGRGDDEYIEIKTKIPLVKAKNPIIKTKIPFIKDMYLHDLPKEYEKISLQTASFSQSSLICKTLSIKIHGLNTHNLKANKWLNLDQKYPVKIKKP